MPTLAITLMTIGTLASAAGLLIWWTAWTTADLDNIGAGRRIATAGRWTGTAAILLWLGGSHPACPAIQALLAVTAVAATATHFTKPRHLTTPRPV